MITNVQSGFRIGLRCEAWKKERLRIPRNMLRNYGQRQKLFKFVTPSTLGTHLIKTQRYEPIQVSAISNNNEWGTSLTALLTSVQVVSKKISLIPQAVLVHDHCERGVVVVRSWPATAVMDKPDIRTSSNNTIQSMSGHFLRPFVLLSVDRNCPLLRKCTISRVKINNFRHWKSKDL